MTSSLSGLKSVIESVLTVPWLEPVEEAMEWFKSRDISRSRRDLWRDGASIIALSVVVVYQVCSANAVIVGVLPLLTVPTRVFHNDANEMRLKFQAKIIPS
jgi:hypothetical protein